MDDRVMMQKSFREMKLYDIPSAEEGGKYQAR
jgi:hypothetical protein